LKSQRFITYSKNTHETTAVSIDINADKPNTARENINAGIRAINTLRINFEVLVLD
jgi:hypothetical protein